MTFRTHLDTAPGKRRFEQLLLDNCAPLPWDSVLDDDKVNIIDFDGNDVGFILFGASKARAVNLAQALVQAVNNCGGHVSVTGAP